MIADADCYFKKPIRDLIEILEGLSGCRSHRGHDSIEHEARRSYVVATGSGERVVKEKAIERGLCLLMRRKILAGCVPFPTDTLLDFDWQLGQRHANSIEALGLKMLAVEMSCISASTTAPGIPLACRPTPASCRRSIHC